MDTTFLQSFLQIVQTGSIAEVARREGVTPAAINQRIKTLEQELGIKLVTRSGRTVCATQEGALIVERAQRVLEELRGLKAAIKGPMIFGTLVLAAFDSAMTTMMPVLIKQLAEHHPKLEVRLIKGYSAALYHDVVNGVVDAAIIVKPQFELPKHFDWHVIREEPLVAIAPAWTKETDRRTLLSINPLICYERSLWGGQLAESYLRQLGLKPKIRVEAASLETIATLVALGVGVAVVPDWSSKDIPGVKKFPLPDSKQTRGVGLLWNTQSPRASLCQEILELLVTAHKRDL
ncbi:LysR family transcriptional regulator [Paucibacter sp. O1-1]|nr:LysR family transcriptional regulator [Paucibacter sp. O1-1]MDA3825062.1 LysR family transcriptional regulator [Paucibacter sp. O1-1]